MIRITEAPELRAALLADLEHKGKKGWTTQEMIDYALMLARGYAPAPARTRGPSRRPGVTAIAKHLRWCMGMAPKLIAPVLPLYKRNWHGGGHEVSSLARPFEHSTDCSICHGSGKNPRALQRAIERTAQHPPQ